VPTTGILEFAPGKRGRGTIRRVTKKNGNIFTYKGKKELRSGCSEVSQRGKYGCVENGEIKESENSAGYCMERRKKDFCPEKERSEQIRNGRKAGGKK